MQTYIPSNMSAEECFRIHGFITPEQTQDLLQVAGVVDRIKGAEAHINEAIGSYPDEGFMKPIEEVLIELKNSTRGENRKKIERLLAFIDDFEMQIFYQSEHGQDELKKLRKALHEAEGKQ